jgi:hypothetical protein
MPVKIFELYKNSSSKLAFYRAREYLLSLYYPLQIISHNIFSNHSLKTKNFYMKKILLISSLAIFVLACNNNDAKDTKTGDSTKMAEIKTDTKVIPEMPYALDRPYQNWQAGDPQHALTVMKSLKAFQNGDINTCIEGFGDSVTVGFDNFQAKLTKDSLKASFTQWRANSASINIKMDDWESVISSDKKNEWVTLWYKEYNTDKKGTVDSMAVVDDCKIVNGKIVVLDEKRQKLGPAKKM